MVNLQMAQPADYHVRILDAFCAEGDAANAGYVPTAAQYAEWVGRTVPVHYNHPSATAESHVPNVGSATIMPDGMAHIHLNSATDPAAAAAASVWTAGDIPGVSIGHSWTFQRDRPVETARLAIDHVAIVKTPAHDTFAFPKRYVYLCPALRFVSVSLTLSAAIFCPWTRLSLPPPLPPPLLPPCRPSSRQQPLLRSRLQSRPRRPPPSRPPATTLRCSRRRPESMPPTATC